MKQIIKEEWSIIRRQGKLKYILTHWILSAALPVAIIMPIIRMVFKGTELSCILSISFLRNVLLYFVLCSVIATFFGRSKWNKYEKQYNLDEF